MIETWSSTKYKFLVQKGGLYVTEQEVYILSGKQRKAFERGLNGESVISVEDGLEIQLKIGR